MQDRPSCTSINQPNKGSLHTSCCACSMLLMTAGLWLTSVKNEKVKGSASSPYTYLPTGTDGT